MITQEQLNIWLEDPVTKALRRSLEREVEDLKTAWAAGAFQHDNPYATHIEQAHQQGRIALAREILELEPTQLVDKD